MDELLKVVNEGKQKKEQQDEMNWRKNLIENTNQVGATKEQIAEYLKDRRENLEFDREDIEETLMEDKYRVKKCVESRNRKPMTQEEIEEDNRIRMEIDAEGWAQQMYSDELAF